MSRKTAKEKAAAKAVEVGTTEPKGPDEGPPAPADAGNSSTTSTDERELFRDDGSDEGPRAIAMTKIAPEKVINDLRRFRMQVTKAHTILDLIGVPRTDGAGNALTLEKRTMRLWSAVEAIWPDDNSTRTDLKRQCERNEGLPPFQMALGLSNEGVEV